MNAIVSLTRPESVVSVCTTLAKTSGVNFLAAPLKSLPLQDAVVKNKKLDVKSAR